MVHPGPLFAKPYKTWIHVFRPLSPEQLDLTYRVLPFSCYFYSLMNAKHASYWSNRPKFKLLYPSCRYNWLIFSQGENYAFLCENNSCVWCLFSKKLLRDRKNVPKNSFLELLSDMLDVQYYWIRDLISTTWNY